ncbi:MAG: hypothetical protein H6618_05415 [Deltaproteobacteria bacterium]|nr:hypothetical protein [Deltaproteobacteria bacterium]
MNILLVLPAGRKRTCFLPFSAWALRLSLSLFLSSACQHSGDVRQQLSAELSPYHKNFFASCSPADGALNIRWYQKDRLLFRAYAEWLSEHKNSWQFQLTDPLGRSLLDLGWNGRSLESATAVPGQLPDLELSESGFLVVNGFVSGLRADELGCLLRGVFPLTWLGQPLHQENSGGKMRYVIPGEERRLVFFGEDPGTEGSETSGFCVSIVRESFWGLFSHQITWCIAAGKDSGSLIAPGHNKIIWKHTDA